MLRRSLVPLLFSALACAKPVTPPDTEAVRAAIQARNDLYTAAYLAHDSSAFRDFLAPDMVQVRAGRPDLIGRDAVVADFAAQMRQQAETILSMKVHTESVDATDSLAFEVGTGMLEHRPKNDPTAKVSIYRTKYITFWQKGADGVWRVRRDLTVADTAQ